MAKPKVVIIGIADWAGSAYNVCQAINSIGDFDCRTITTYKHPFEYPTDIIVPIFPVRDKCIIYDAVHRAVNSKQYEEACNVLEQADIIHLWNTLMEPDFMGNGLPVRFSKVKVVTWTGSAYRRDHKIINEVSRQFDQWKTVVQDPMLRFPDEIDSTFIPHAIDVESFLPQDEREKKIGTYRPSYTSDVRHAPKDIARLYEFIKEYPDWRIDLDYSMPHKERMERLAKCSVFVQDLSPDIGYWGRSTLEACALGIPVMQNYNGDVLKYTNSEGKLGNPQIVGVDSKSFESVLVKLIQDEDYRKGVGRCSRNWVESHFSYPVVGKMYSDIYNEI